MLWVKAFHIIALVSWFAGLFYLPRLFIYHTKWNDSLSNDHFKIMERNLHQPWMHIKLTLVFLLVIYHLYLGRIVREFQRNTNKHKLGFYHMLHGLPSLFLISIVCLVVVKP
jgi:protoporphyrinogen IX oxidase